MRCLKHFCLALWINILLVKNFEDTEMKGYMEEYHCLTSFPQGIELSFLLIHDSFGNS